MPRVYSGTRRATVARWLVLLLAHLAAVALGMMLAEAIVIVDHVWSHLQ